jgi:glycosyltransferase involved in cell wall biosynthesis
MEDRPETDVLRRAPLPKSKLREEAVGGDVLESDARDLAPPELSFVIPAFNEEELISRTIDSIRQFVPPFSYEIIVVDNCSTDATAAVAAELGATVIQQADGTIGALRNAGVRRACGEILVFLDADVVLTAEWAAQIPESLAAIKLEPTMMTGAWCSVPADASRLERWWFAPRIGSSHLGTGHMIVTRRFFHELGGFDESLATGEDYEISRRAITVGGRIAIDDRLRAEHLGFPRTIGAFVRREAWHGVGDYSSLGVFVRSKVSLATFAFVLFHALILGGLVTRTSLVIGIGVAGVATVCLASSFWKYWRQPIHVILHNTMMYWLYYFGRALSMIPGTARRSRA